MSVRATGGDRMLLGGPNLGVGPVQARIPGRVGDVVSGLDPLVTLVGLGILVVVLAALWTWMASRSRSTAASFRHHLAAADAVAVLTHPRPDPDAMASAVAAADIAEHADTPATVYHPGEIRRPENRAFRAVLDIDMQRLTSAADVADEAVVLVDHNEPRGFDGAEDVTPYCIVDHHPGGGDATAFSDVRTDHGACASILAGYFEALDAVRPGDEPAGGRRPGRNRLRLGTQTATGLAYGVLSDTTNLTRGASPADYAAMEYLHPAVDADALDRIANPDLDAAVLEARARAVLEREHRPPYVVSDVGAVDNLDAIPQAADVLLLLEGVTAAVVVGEQSDALYLSARSRDDRVHVGHALEAAVADVEGASAGGHARMGGAELPRAAVAELRPGSGVVQTGGALTRSALRERLFDAMAGER